MSTKVGLIETPLRSTTVGRLWRGVASTALGQVISSANSILLVPLFLRAWGADGYGQWLSLTALTSYLSLLDLGGQNFIGNLLAREYMRGNEDEFRQKLSEGVSLLALIALVGFCLFGIVLSLPGISLPGQSASLSLDERFVLLLMGAVFLLSIPGGVYVTAYRATGQLARGTMIGNVCRALSLLCYAAILIASMPPTVYAAAYLAIGIISTTVIVWDMQRRIPACRRINLNLAAARTGRIHLGGSLLFWLLALASALNQQGVILVLAASGSPVTVAVYATHRAVSGLVGYVGSLLQAPLWTELSFAYVQKNRDKMVRMAMLAIKTVPFLSGAVALGLWVLLPAIYPIWTGRHLQLQPLLLVLFLGQAVLAAGWTTSGWSLLATNQHRSLAYWSLANAVLTVMLAMILAPRYGVLGVACASLIGDVICGVAVYPRLASRLLGLSVIKTYQSMLYPLIVLIPLGMLLMLAAPLIEGWQLIVFGGLLALVFAYPAAYLVFGKHELDWLVGRCQTLERSGA